jgi:Polyketide cyclase / dehydrase and lipid transport
MLEVTVIEHFELDRPRLWDALADLEGHREWMTDVRTLHFLTEQRSGVGTRYEITVGRLRLRDHIEVKAWDRPRELAIAHRIGPARGEGRFLLTADGSGTRLEWRARFEVPWWAGGRLTERLGVPSTRRLLTRNLGSLRRWLTDRL